ncbi:hypothetical protein LCGC14_0873660 [marine sediment metagenome]|uniref:Uncharacterized protein n=1 Tax=marine sediment metagenome TaxID=412755 RepID=A0A0F9P8V8_9ZZZZ
MSDLPLDHIVRDGPTWTTLPQLTECGRLLNDIAAAIEWDMFVAKVKRLGKQRTSMTTCMTCWNRATYRPELGAERVEAVSRYVGRVYRNADAGRVVLAELEAIERLVEAHRDEYDDLVKGIRHVVRLEGQR